MYRSPANWASHRWSRCKQQRAVCPASAGVSHGEEAYTAFCASTGRPLAPLRGRRAARPFPSIPRWWPRLAHGSCGVPSAPRPPRRSGSEPGVERRGSGLDIQCRRGEGRASGVPWGEGLGTGGFGKRLGGGALRPWRHCVGAGRLRPAAATASAEGALRPSSRRRSNRRTAYTSVAMPLTHSHPLTPDGERRGSPPRGPRLPSRRRRRCGRARGCRVWPSSRQ